MPGLEGPKMEKFFPPLSLHLPTPQSCPLPSSQLCPLTPQPSRGRMGTVTVTSGPAGQGVNKYLWNQQTLPEGLAPGTQAAQIHPIRGLYCPALPPPQSQAHSSAMSSVSLKSPGGLGQRPSWPDAAARKLGQCLLNQHVLFPATSHGVGQRHGKGELCGRGCGTWL